MSNGMPPAIAGQIVIQLHQDGKVHCQAQVPNREVGRLMMQLGWAQAEMNLYAQEQAAKVQPVPALALDDLGGR